jgi:hypothetical protein
MAQSTNIKKISDLVAICYPIIRDLHNNALKAIETNHISTEEIASVIYSSAHQYDIARQAVLVGLPVEQHSLAIHAGDEGQPAISVVLAQPSNAEAHAVWPHGGYVATEALPAAMQAVVSEARAITTQVLRMTWLVKLLAARCAQVPHALFMWPNLRYVFPTGKTDFFKPKAPSDIPDIPAEVRSWIPELDLFLVRCRSWQAEERTLRSGGIRISSLAHNQYVGGELSFPVDDAGGRRVVRHSSIAGLAEEELRANNQPNLL